MIVHYPARYLWHFFTDLTPPRPILSSRCAGIFLIFFYLSLFGWYESIAADSLFI